MKSLRNCIVFILAGMFVFISCASGPQKARFTPIQDLKKLGAPEWVIKRSGAFNDVKGRVFYGIDSSKYMSNISLLMSAADNRAINNLAKEIEVYTASLMKDYTASTSAGEGEGSSDEQHMERAIKTVVKQTLSGVKIIDHWQNPETGEMFSLAKLDLDAFKDTAEKVKELDAKVKEHIKKNAEKLYDQLEKEEEKMKGAEK